MKLKNKFIIMGTIAFGLVGSTKAFAIDNSSIRQIIEPKNAVSVDKVWKINFSKQLNKDSVTKNSIKVLNKNGQTIEMNFKIAFDEKSVEITPLKDKYKKGETYSIIIAKDLKDKNNKPLKQETRMKFTIEKETSNGSSSSGGSSSSSSASSGSQVKVSPAVKSAREGLLRIKPIVKSKGQKDLVDYLVNTLDKRISNNDYKVNSEEVKKKYKSLPLAEQESFKNVICATFTIGELMDIRDALGV
ncbi:Ig-like domain-containing protein [Clostridium botulinum]|uniref:Cell wall hydrolase n=1 Tax=Clostridium botulinum TaxID=1491 RepID=A0A9Q1UZD8_CLOBO|nr:Ig-like domain-containing protein [Clostridium botulinum]AEB75384.1 putative cell wall hydrolase [Clostridium botulinum BKT015925]KEH99900.1 cell wall hydrolase [Clostridium botulinum D str. 16868]KEI03780.1 cell wall hydrolase [Clostridium botulinum C/D str. Sp77]KLU76396.1 cell wall hydrolase [Clostridium botulinum V891]KOA73648.1 cell wall hydrolase [Clostridium botulinum]